MKWTYKYEGSMDTNDGDYVYSSGTLGVFNDGNIDDMKAVHQMMMYMNAYAENFDDGHADCDKVRETFERKCKSYGLEELEYKNYSLDMYEYRPEDPNDDSNAHNLKFTFKRLPADVVEQNVDEFCLRQYYNVNRG
jgi:hypothetical protein